MSAQHLDPLPDRGHTDTISGAPGRKPGATQSPTDASFAATPAVRIEGRSVAHPAKRDVRAPNLAELANPCGTAHRYA
jgi:hypothetical protein